jgi:hypothetical protein
MICSKPWVVVNPTEGSLPTLIPTYRAAECLLLLAINEFTNWVPTMPSQFQMTISTCVDTGTLGLSVNHDISEYTEMISEAFGRIMAMEKVIVENAVTNKTPAHQRQSFFSVQMPWSFKDDFGDLLHRHGSPCVACQRHWTIMCQLYHQITSGGYSTSHTGGSKSKRKSAASKKTSSKSHTKTVNRTKTAPSKRSLAADTSPVATRPNNRSITRRKVTFLDEFDNESDVEEDVRPPSKQAKPALTKQSVQANVKASPNHGGMEEDAHDIVEEEDDLIEESDEENDLALYDSSTEEEEEEEDDEDFQPSIKYAEDDELVIAPQNNRSDELEDDSEYDDDGNDEEGQGDEEEDDEDSVYVASMNQQQDPEPEDENSWQ